MVGMDLDGGGEGELNQANNSVHWCSASIRGRASIDSVHLWLSQ